jgi:hypothetical protein
METVLLQFVYNIRVNDGAPPLWHFARAYFMFVTLAAGLTGFEGSSRGYGVVQLI